MGVGVVWCGVVVSTLAPQKGGPTFLLLLLLLPLLSSPSPFGVRKNHVAHHDCICGVRGPPRAVSLSSAVWPSPGSSSGVSSSVGAVRNESLSSPSRLLPFLGYWGGSPAVMAGSPAFFSWTGEQSRGPSLVGPVRDESPTITYHDLGFTSSGYRRMRTGPFAIARGQISPEYYIPFPPRPFRSFLLSGDARIRGGTHFLPSGPGNRV